MSGVLGTYAYTNCQSQYLRILGKCGVNTVNAVFNVQGGYRQGGITCAMPAGSLVGALASSFIADRFSRKTAIQVAAVIWIVGSM